MSQNKMRVEIVGANAEKSWAKASRMKMIVVVTGASRGAGKGIALALGAAGATVYVTGRSVAEGDSPYGGTVAETAQRITEVGGKGIAVAVDHDDDQAVAALFDRIKQEHGKLDILVNNAANPIATTTDVGGFWEKPVETVGLLNVGLRSHFVTSYYAAPLLIANGRGLIVNTGHYGAVCYFRGPVYGGRRQEPIRWRPTWPWNCACTMSRPCRSGWVASIRRARGLIWRACRPNHVRQPSGNHRSSPAGLSRPHTIPTRGCSFQDEC
jgi:hypothetical protein